MTDRRASCRRPRRRPSEWERGLTVRSTRTAAAVLLRSPPPALLRRGSWGDVRLAPPLGPRRSRPSVTLPHRKSRSSVAAAGVWRARAGRAGIDEQAAPDGPDGVPDQQRHEQACVAPRAARIGRIHHPGPKGGSASATPRSEGSPFRASHSQCVGDGVPTSGDRRTGVAPG